MQIYQKLLQNQHKTVRFFPTKSLKYKTKLEITMAQQKQFVREIADINDNGKLDARDYLLLKRAFFKTYTIK